MNIENEELKTIKYSTPCCVSVSTFQQETIYKPYLLETLKISGKLKNEKRSETTKKNEKRKQEKWQS